jgi:hypothetical protein
VRALLACLATFALAGCAGEQSSAPGTAAAPATTGAPTSTVAQDGQSQAPPDIVPAGGIPKVRALQEKFSRSVPELEEGVRATTALVGPVRCWTLEGWRKLEAAQGVPSGYLIGLTDISSATIHLHPYVCDWLAALLDGKRFDAGDDAEQAAQSLVALAHEGGHLSSAGTNEALVECRAMQRADEVAARLGIDQDYGQRLSEIYWEDAYPLLDPNYRSPECHDGGTMDLDPDDSVWP